MNANELTKLAERVEAMGDFDYRLEDEVKIAFYHLTGSNPGPVLRSLDAAMTLVPEGAQWRLDTMTGNAFCYRPFGGLDARGTATTPALALTAAALRARAAMEVTK